MQLTESTRKTLRQLAMHRARRSSSMTLLFMACTALVFGTVSAIRAIPNLGPRLPAPLVFIVVVMIVTWVFSNAAVRISNRFTRVQYRSLLNNLRCRRAEDTRARNRLLGR